MRPVHPLREGSARVVSGVAAVFAPSRDVPPGQTAAAEAMQELSAPRGVSPFAALQIGLGDGFEADTGYNGRSLHLGGRHGWTKRSWAVSVGGSASTLVTPRSRTGPSLASAHGYGFEVPVVAGWQSEGGLYAAWLGARGGFDRASVDGVLDPISLAPRALGVSRFSTGGVFGLMAGAPPFNVGLEIAVTHHWASATVGDTKLSSSWLSWSPAAAVLLRL